MSVGAAPQNIEAEREQLFARLRSLNCELRVLPRHGTLADMWASGVLSSYASRCVLALDFDQTLTQVDKTQEMGMQLKLRGGDAARRALQEMHAAGVTLLIITAQSPSVQTLINLAAELRHLGIHSLFGLADGPDDTAQSPSSGSPTAASPLPPSPRLLSGASSLSVALDVASAAAPDVPAVVTLEGGIKIARMANLLAARYNKPEAFEYWLRSCAPRDMPTPTKLGFVDDNSDNAVSMFMHFAASEMCESKARDTSPPSAPRIPICAMWYPPPAGLKGEAFDEATRALLMAVSRGEIAVDGNLQAAGADSELAAGVAATDIS
jgi:hypothetical protein